MELKRCGSDALAIATLLREGFEYQPIVLVRGFIETVANFCWVTAADSETEKRERMYRLEADGYRHMSKECRQMQANVVIENPFWSAEEAKRMDFELQQLADSAPWLTQISGGKRQFKDAPPLDIRMGADVRIRLYHLYRFACLFSHSTPTTKKLFVKPGSASGEDIQHEILRQFMAYGVWMLYLVLGAVVDVFVEQPNHSSRAECHQSLHKLAEEAGKGVFTMPPA
jgi:hypothetical protein